MQTDAMQGSKGRKRTARQSIKVTRESHHHQHIHVHRGPEQNDGQSQARRDDTAAGTIDQRPTVRREDTGNNVLPLPMREGQEPLPDARRKRSEEHTSELQSLMRSSYAVFCLKKKNQTSNNTRMSKHKI